MVRDTLYWNLLESIGRSHVVSLEVRKKPVIFRTHLWMISPYFPIETSIFPWLKVTPSPWLSFLGPGLYQLSELPHTGAGSSH